MGCAAIHATASSYMGKEVVTQLLVALLLTGIALLTRRLPLAHRVGVAALAGMGAAAAIYGQLINWWGLPWMYGLGASVNLVITWTLGGLVVARFVLPDSVAHG